MTVTNVGQFNVFNKIVYQGKVLAHEARVSSYIQESRGNYTMTTQGTKFNLCCKKPTNSIWWKGTITIDWLYEFWFIKPNVSYFGWIYSFNNVSSWLSTSNGFDGLALLGLQDTIGESRLVLI